MDGGLFSPQVAGCNASKPMATHDALWHDSLQGRHLWSPTKKSHAELDNFQEARQVFPPNPQKGEDPGVTCPLDQTGRCQAAGPAEMKFEVGRSRGRGEEGRETESDIRQWPLRVQLFPLVCHPCPLVAGMDPADPTYLPSPSVVCLVYLHTYIDYYTALVYVTAERELGSPWLGCPPNQRSPRCFFYTTPSSFSLLFRCQLCVSGAAVLPSPRALQVVHQPSPPFTRTRPYRPSSSLPSFRTPLLSLPFRTLPKFSCSRIQILHYSLS